MIDQFFNRIYNRKTYNCAHFVSEVFKSETGRDIAHIMKGFLLPPDERSAKPEIKHNFTRLATPHSPCIVLMSRARTEPHVGLFLRGKVFHLTETGGVQFMPLGIASLGFTKTRFYSC